MKLNELKVINYRIVDGQHIGVQYNKEYVDFISKHKGMLQLKTMESIVTATMSGYPMSGDEAAAAHTTNIIMYLIMTGRQNELPTAKGLVPLALTITSIEEMITEQILIDDEELERKRK